MLPLIGSVVLNMAKTAVLKKALSLTVDFVEGVKGGLSSRNGERLVEDSYKTDSVSSRLLVYSRAPQVLRENASQAANAMSNIGAVASSANLLKTLALTTSVSSVALALSTAFAKDHKAIRKAIAPGFDTTLPRIFEGTAEQLKAIPVISDLFKNNRLSSGFKTGNLDSVVSAVSSVLPSNIINNSEFILDKNARVEKKFGTQQTTPTPKPSQSR
jgi:hypothetical protein